MELEGEFLVPLSRQVVYNFFMDPHKFGKAIPDVEELNVLDNDSFMARVRVGISYIKGSLGMQFERVAAEDGQAATYRGKGLGMGSFAEVEASFRLEDLQDGGTRVKWRGEAKIGGRLAGMGGGLLEPVARKNTTRFITAIEAGLRDMT
ncbi:MAG: SRPBCC family protein [Candidatus Tectomicrobia bacterium]|uniref:SRPBCC family protein n=1 Tax=Tectimicrobiota bacterium TaxID=2528274 RepID=A0A932GN30_UNCTE|nr:SRPBCC family protein [Candidatus Tectomicrobia bacterium]